MNTEARTVGRVDYADFNLIQATLDTVVIPYAKVLSGMAITAHPWTLEFTHETAAAVARLGSIEKEMN